MAVVRLAGSSAALACFLLLGGSLRRSAEWLVLLQPALRDFRVWGGTHGEASW
jgi:hypothetical protein